MTHGAEAALTAILRAKLAIPALPPDTLPRTELVRGLSNAASPGRLTLVVAGAGWGKSTLLALWARRQVDPARVAWLSIDAGDNDPPLFWAHVLAGLLQIVDGGGGSFAQLRAAPDFASTVEQLVPALVREVAAETEPLSLVLDGYHLIEDAEVHAGVAVLARSLPATLRLVIATRRDQLAGIPYLGADIGPADLRFSAAEAAELLGRETGAMTADDATLVYQRTEGWPAGVQHAAAAWRGRTESVGVSAVVRGDNGEIADYLRTHVLAELPADIRAFLRRTSVLARFTPELCAAVTGRDDAADLLGRAERDQLFLTRVDGDGYGDADWWRFHPQFGELLAADLRQHEPQLVAELHRRAARWHDAQQLRVDAVRHAFESGDLDLASELVAKHAVSVCFRGNVDTVLGWFTAIGDERCKADPSLCIVRCTVAAGGGDLAEIDRWARFATEAIQLPDTPPEVVNATRVGLHLIQWGASYYCGDTAASLAAAEATLEYAADDPTPWRTGTALATSLYRTGQRHEADALLAEHGGLAEANGEHLVAMINLGVRAIIAATDDQPEEAERLAAAAEELSDRHGLREHYGAWTYHMAHGWSLLRAGDYPRAAVPLRRARQLVRRAPMALENIEALTAVAIVEQRLGYRERADRHLERALHRLKRCSDPGVLVADPRNVVEDEKWAPSSPAGPPGDLSRREVEVLSIVGEGLPTKAVAARLGLSPRTVHAHLRSIYRKIGVTSRAAATRWAIAHGLTSQPTTDPPKTDPT